MKYCCTPFKAHVGYKLFTPANWGDEVTGKWYKGASWQAMVVETEEKDGWINLKTPKGETNLMPISHCPFCGKKLKSGK